MPAYTLLYPLIEIEFHGAPALLKDYYDSEYTVVEKICKKIGNTQECKKRYFTVDYRSVPKELLASTNLNIADRLRVITLYIAKHLKKQCINTRKGFIDRTKPIWETKIKVINADATLRIYRGFRTEYYVINRNQTKFRISVVPVYEFEITPVLSEILRANVQSGIHRDSILNELEGIELSTIEPYWKGNIGPKYAGRLVYFYFPIDAQYKEKQESIQKYYQKKKKWHKVLELCPKPEEDIIVTVERYTGGEKSYPDYLGGLLVLTPNLETLSLFIEQGFSMIHDIMRPRPRKNLYRKDYQEFYNKIRETVENYVEILREIPLIEVKKNAIMV